MRLGRNSRTTQLDGRRGVGWETPRQRSCLQSRLPGMMDSPSTQVTALRWTTAVAVAITGHALVWLALIWRLAETTPAEPPAAIELTAIPMAPEMPQNIAPGPQITEAQRESPSAVPEVDEEPTVLEPITSVDQSMDIQPISDPQPEIKVSELPKVDETERMPDATPPLFKPKAQKPPLKTREVDRKKSINRQTTAPPTSNARNGVTAAAPSAGASFDSSRSSASWKSALMAHLNRYKRFPPGAISSGTTSIAFTISRSGQVLSSRLVRSSGEGVLDQEAVALPRRASPVPAPPPSVGGASITLSVPIRFDR